MPPRADPAADDLAGRRILVAGATGRVGRVVSRLAAARGAAVVLHGRTDGPGLRELADRVGAAGVVAGDLMDPGAAGRLRDAAGPALHAVVNCVTGFDGRPVAVDELAVAEFRRIVDVDLVGGFALLSAVLPALRRAGDARVVLLSSLAGLRGRPGAAHLCAAKAGVHGLALGLARDLAPDGIGVHVVAPGPIGHHAAPTGVPACAEDDVAEAVLALCRPGPGPQSGSVHAIEGSLAAA